MRLRQRLCIPPYALAALALLARGVDSSALAEPSPSPAPTAQCSLRGQPVMPIDAPILDVAGHPIARFSGAPTPLVASNFSADPQGKVPIETGFGAGSFRIRGFIDPSLLPLYTASNVAVYSGHVWIAANRAVTLLGSGAGRLRVEKKLSAPIQQSFKGTASCGALSLEAGVASGFTPAGDARAYVLKQDSLDLFADPSADSPILTLHRSPHADGVLFFSTERKGGFVRLGYHGEIVIDAWAKAEAISALPPGETMDQLAPATSQRSTPQMALQGQPKVVRPAKEIPLHRAAKDADVAIGVIEAGAETYVLDQVAGWASVLPKSLAVLPAAGGQFWAKSSDLGL